MDIDRIIDSVYEDKSTQKVQNSCADQTKPTLNDMSLKELLTMPLNEDIEIEIYSRFKYDIEMYIEDFLSRSKDVNADNGMFKCCLETWQSCIYEVGIYYFNKNKYLRDIERIRAGGGVAYRDDLLRIGICLYEELCQEYRKQFFIYDCCKFLGMSLDTMYKLNDLHAELLKKYHSMQESSMRTALASGRSNVTAMAILLNHDYNYTKTTEIIHTNSSQVISAEKLPELDNKQNIVINPDILTDDLM